MIQANLTIFKFYLSLMNSFSEYLIQEYNESSLDNPNHFKAQMIRKIVNMFQTLDLLTSKTLDEASARSVLRGILDSITIYCFIYNRKDEKNIMYRHYLYILDGWKIYKEYVVNGVLKEGEDTIAITSQCDEAIRQIEDRLYSHSFSKLNSANVKDIINKSNWKYVSLDSTKSYKFLQMYKVIGLDESMANYYQYYLSQFSHGLCLSNSVTTDPKQIKKVLYESISICHILIHAIFSTFPRKSNLQHILKKSVTDFCGSSDFDYDNMVDFMNALLKKDNSIVI